MMVWLVWIVIIVYLPPPEDIWLTSQATGPII